MNNNIDFHFKKFKFVFFIEIFNEKFLFGKNFKNKNSKKKAYLLKNQTRNFSYFKQKNWK